MNKYLRFKEVKSSNSGIEKFGVSFVNFSLVHNLSIQWDEQYTRARLEFKIHQSTDGPETRILFKKFDSEKHFIFWKKEFTEFSKNESMYFDLGVNEL
ncbi:hypothetical protein V7S76_08325 [Aquirufa sp. ROCK2-A2]